MALIVVDSSAVVAGADLTIQPKKNGSSWGSSFNLGVGYATVAHDPYNTTTRAFTGSSDIGFTVSGAGGTTGSYDVTIRLYTMKVKV
jgi:hypothetical protein